MPAPKNPYIVPPKLQEGLPADLHPLVLLSISDHITRHALRNDRGPVVGAILGQRNLKQISLEHTFDFTVEKAADGSAYFNTAWFNDRLAQMRVVHKDNSLELVGWYALFSRAGPTASIMQVHEQILQVFSTCYPASDNVLLLAFHPEDLQQKSTGGKLPITLYETTIKKDENDAEDAEDAKDAASPVSSEASQDQVMEDIAAETSPAVPFPFHLSEVEYSVESDEAEMISINFIARGAANASTKTGAPAASGSSSASASANATATAPAGAATAATAATGGTVSPNSSRDRAVAIESGNRSKKRLVSAGPDDSTATAERATGTATGPGPGPGPAASTKTTASSALSAAEEDLIATLTTRANAVRMLHARLQLLTKYVDSLPADALSAEEERVSPESSTSTNVSVSLTMLRSIKALLQNLVLAVPVAPKNFFDEEQQRETNDVELMSMLLDDMVGGLSSIQGLHKKLAAVESYRWYSARQEQHGIHQMAISARENADAQPRKSTGAVYSTQGGV